MSAGPMIDWRLINTVLLDMDGTLLDLHFDNYFWQEYVPQRYAEHHGLAPDEAQQRIMALYREKVGTLDWYCVDHWTHTLQLDIPHLKEEVAHLIAVRPGVPHFLESLRRHGKHVALVTNAHRKSLTLKMSRTNLQSHFDQMISSHELGYPKEDPLFWKALHDVVPYEESRTLFIDDNLPVLRCAQSAGIAHLLTIQRPDSRLPAHETEEFIALQSFSQIQPG